MLNPIPDFPANIIDEQRQKGTHLGPAAYEDKDTSRSGGGDRTWQEASAQTAYFRLITQGESYSWEKRRSVLNLFIIIFSHGVGKKHNVHGPRLEKTPQIA